MLNGQSMITDYVRAVTEVFVDRFINYLHDRIDEGNNVIYLLEKYKRRTEWFHNKELFDRIQADPVIQKQFLTVVFGSICLTKGLIIPFQDHHRRVVKRMW